MVDIPYPQSSTPGQRPGEGQGRLINCFCEVDGASWSWLVLPGLVAFTDLGVPGYRGAINVNGLLYVAVGNAVQTVDGNGTVTTLSGALPGSGPVTFARNNDAPTPDVVCVSTAGAFIVTPTTVESYTDPDLPQPVSVCFLDGYFLFAIGDGRIFASDLNSPAIDALSFATAESKPDGLLRGVAAGELSYFFGPESLEIWNNAGTLPFPLARASVVACGMIGPWAVAGDADGWDKPLIFVAADGTVREMVGYTPTPISTRDVEKAIAAVADKTTLQATVYTFGGQAIWSLTSPIWTWEYNVTTGFWHERQSLNRTGWRAVGSVLFNGSWLVGDNASTNLQRISTGAFDENGDELVMTIESGDVKQFPMRIATPAAYFAWISGQGTTLGDPESTNPTVSISWSHDGGSTWSTPNLRPMLGAQGDSRRLVRQNRAGLTTHHGIRWRQSCAAPVYRRFVSGQMDAHLRAA